MFAFSFCSYWYGGFHISGLFYANTVSCMLMKDSIDIVVVFGFARFLSVDLVCKVCIARLSFSNN